MKKQQGFTLTELLITMAIIAIIATMAAPSFSDAMAKQKLERSSRELALTLDRARTKAVLERREITVNLEGTGENDNDTLQWSPIGGVTKNSSTVNEVVFTTVGIVKDLTGSNEVIVKLCSSSVEKSKTVSIDRMGNITQSSIKEGC